MEQGPTETTKAHARYGNTGGLSLAPHEEIGNAGSSRNVDRQSFAASSLPCGAMRAGFSESRSIPSATARRAIWETEKSPPRRDRTAAIRRSNSGSALKCTSPVLTGCDRTCPYVPQLYSIGKPANILSRVERSVRRLGWFTKLHIAVVRMVHEVSRTVPAARRCVLET